MDFPLQKKISLSICSIKWVCSSNTTQKWLNQSIINLTIQQMLFDEPNLYLFLHNWMCLQIEILFYFVFVFLLLLKNWFWLHMDFGGLSAIIKKNAVTVKSVLNSRNFCSWLCTYEVKWINRYLIWGAES